MDSKVEVTLKLAGDLSRLSLGPGDIAWIKLSGEYSQMSSMAAIARNFRRMLKDAGHDNQVIVSDNRMEILIVTPE